MMHSSNLVLPQSVVPDMMWIRQMYIQDKKMHMRGPRGSKVHQQADTVTEWGQSEASPLFYMKVCAPKKYRQTVSFATRTLRFDPAKGLRGKPRLKDLLIRRFEQVLLETNDVSYEFWLLTNAILALLDCASAVREERARSFCSLLPALRLRPLRAPSTAPAVLRTLTERWRTHSVTRSQ